MNKDDIDYVLELLEDAIIGQDWDLIEEARQYLNDFAKNGKKSKYVDEE
jgi:hypothetical protein